MCFRLSGNQLTYPKRYIKYFKEIKDKNIQLDLKIDDLYQYNVLQNKTVEIDGCPDITKLSDIKTALIKCKNNRIKIKNITIELECEE